MESERSDESSGSLDGIEVDDAPLSARWNDQLELRYAQLALRLCLAATLGYIGWSKLSQPDDWLIFLPHRLFEHMSPGNPNAPGAYTHSLRFLPGRQVQALARLVTVAGIPRLALYATKSTKAR